MAAPGSNKTRLGHGTRACYARGCRRAECRRAASEYNRRQQRWKGYGNDGGRDFVDPFETRLLLESLLAAGWSRHQLERESKVKRGTLGAILAGERSRVHKDTARAVEALRGRPVPVAAHAVVDGTETWRLIGELVDAGIARYRIARALGQESATGLQFRANVLARTARAVEELHWRAWVASHAVREACRCEVPREIRDRLEGH